MLPVRTTIAVTALVALAPLTGATTAHAGDRGPAVVQAAVGTADRAGDVTGPVRGRAAAATDLRSVEFRTTAGRLQVTARLADLTPAPAGRVRYRFDVRSHGTRLYRGSLRGTRGAAVTDLRTGTVRGCGIASVDARRDTVTWTVPLSCLPRARGRLASVRAVAVARDHGTAVGRDRTGYPWPLPLS